MTVQEWGQDVQRTVSAGFYGKETGVRRLLVALLCRGHVLIEDVPGVGKTVLARVLAQAMGGEFRQIQCTPDLLPADVLGVSIFSPRSGEFEFRPGPIVSNIVLVDEINRATPRTQSALLEAMAESQVSVEGRSLPLPDPFFLIATESPVESEGTFSLPEVQKDRFFLSTSLGYPTPEDEMRLMRMQRTLNAGRQRDRAGDGADAIGVLRGMQDVVIQVHVSPAVRKYILSIVRASRGDERLVLGISPRGSLALYKGAQAMAALQGRDYASPEDVQEICGPVLRKRVLLKPEHAARGLTEDAFVADLLGRVGVPPVADAL